METNVKCALVKNKFLLEECEEPYNWINDQNNDNWEKTKNSRCEKYSKGKYITLDPDREIDLSDESDDPEQVKAIMISDGQISNDKN
jgi:hypothetical protein